MKIYAVAFLIQSVMRSNQDIFCTLMAHENKSSRWVIHRKCW